MMTTSRPHHGPARAFIAAACVAALSTGCTMCPDPYDYTGPVPNGSPPQNDFRARSNGILPLGAAPKPWPPIVKSEPTGDFAPQGSEPLVAEYPTSAGRDTNRAELAAASVGDDGDSRDDEDGEGSSSVAADGPDEPALPAEPPLELVPVPIAEHSAEEASAGGDGDARAPRAARRDRKAAWDVTRWLRWR